MLKRSCMVLLAALALAACGGDDEGGGGGGDALDKAAIAAEANKICDAQQKKAEQVEAPANLQEASAAADYFGDIAPILQEEVDQLSELTPDDDVKTDWDAFLAAENEANDLLQTVAQKAEDEDASGLQELQKLEPLTTELSTKAKAVGATRCGA